AEWSLALACEVVDGGFQQGEAGGTAIELRDEQRAPVPSGVEGAVNGTGEASLEEVVETAHFAGHDLGSRPPRGRPERGEAPGRGDDELAIGGGAFANGDHVIFSAW